jgi:diketogulonate reductase-like aldo/keto reductase
LLATCRYGGAWKAPYGEALALSAIRTGFRAFDSANCFLQAYNETAFGAAFRTAIAEGVVTREDLFVQTK